MPRADDVTALLAMNPADENHDEALPELQNETHGTLDGEAVKLRHRANDKGAEKCLLNRFLPLAGF